MTALYMGVLKRPECKGGVAILADDSGVIALGVTGKSGEQAGYPLTLEQAFTLRAALDAAIQAVPVVEDPEMSRWKGAMDKWESSKEVVA